MSNFHFNTLILCNGSIVGNMIVMQNLPQTQIPIYASYSEVHTWNNFQGVMHPKIVKDIHGITSRFYTLLKELNPTYSLYNH